MHNVTFAKQYQHGSELPKSAAGNRKHATLVPKAPADIKLSAIGSQRSILGQKRARSPLDPNNTAHVPKANRQKVIKEPTKKSNKENALRVEPKIVSTYTQLDPVRIIGSGSFGKYHLKYDLIHREFWFYFFD